MEERRFDQLSKTLAKSVGRRGFIRGVLATAFGGALASAGGALAAPGEKYGNSVCAHFCHAVLDGAAAGKCTSDAAHGVGLCYECAANPDNVCFGPNGPYCPDFQNDVNNCGGCGISCDDSDECTVDSCVAGSCVHTPSVDCPECQACDPASGTCVAANEGGSCNGGAGTCQSGNCVSLCEGVTCPECQACDPASGNCVAANDGASCGPEGAGTCSGGVCNLPQCAGAECGSYTQCSDTCDCQCYTTAEGIGTCGYNTPCEGIQSCAATSDCPSGSICVVNSCCGAAGVCVAICSASDICMAATPLVQGGPTTSSR